MNIKLRSEDGQNIIDSCTAQEIIDTLTEYIDKYGQYGPVEMFVYGMADIEIEYRSPETEQEFQWKNRRKQAQVKQEREEYERLKEKYGE